jgi:hypothetical protein
MSTNYHFVVISGQASLFGIGNIGDIVTSNDLLAKGINLTVAAANGYIAGVPVGSPDPVPPVYSGNFTCRVDSLGGLPNIIKGQTYPLSMLPANADIGNLVACNAIVLGTPPS